MMKPFKNEDAKRFEARMNRIHAQQVKELEKAMYHLDNATMLLEAFISTARNEICSAYYSVIPYGDMLVAVQNYAMPGVIGKPESKLSEDERLGKTGIDVIIGNFFPEEMHGKLKFDGLSYFGERLDRLIFKFSFGKELLELYVPNISTASSQCLVTDSEFALSKLRLYEEMSSSAVMQYNLWRSTVYHTVDDSHGIQTMVNIAESYDPEKIREQLSKWINERKAKK